MKTAYALVVVLGCSTSNHLPGSSQQQDSALAPTPVAFALLPINSVRGEVKGYDAANDLCVRAIWDYSNHGEAFGKHCNDFAAGFPYVHVAPGACDATVEYAGNLDVISATGCVDFADLGATSTNQVDATLDVTGAVFTGTITVKGP